MKVKTSRATPKIAGDHLTWIEISSILARLTAQVHATLRYLPPNHPQEFCQSLIGTGKELERLANQTGAFMRKSPKTAGHSHKKAPP